MKIFIKKIAILLVFIFTLSFSKGLTINSWLSVYADEINNEDVSFIDAGNSASRENSNYDNLGGIINKEVIDNADILSVPEKKTDFPVHIVQRTGLDTEKSVILFLGDGYTDSEQDKFVNDVTERVRRLFEIEPYKSYSNEFNVYAIKVVSNESGAGRHPTNGVGGIDLDTYFKIKFNHNNTERLMYFSGDGLLNAKALIDQFNNNYLDRGATILSSNILCNSTKYGGSGGGISISSLASGEKMVAHESAHSFAKLADEYFAGVGEAANRTKESDPKLVRWKEFLGFRAIDVVHYGTSDSGTKVYKPITSNCIMNSLYKSGFCEVCKLQIASHFNGKIKNKRDFYIADPITTIKLDDGTYNSGKEITDTNIIEAEGEKLEFRTVVKNYSTSNKDLTMNINILDKDGQVKYTSSQDFTLIPNELKSLSVVTDELTELMSDDKIYGTLVDKNINSEIKIYEGVSKKYGTVSIKFKFASNLGTTNIDIPLTAEQLIKIESGSNYEISQPILNGYVSLGSNIETPYVTIDEGNTEIIYYYAKEKGKVTSILLDENGSKIDEKERVIKYNTTFIPSEKDFEGKENYSLIVPNAVTFDGINDITLIYKYAKGTQPIINGVGNSTISKGETINLLDGVSAIDNEDGDITKDIIIEGEVDSSTRGDYDISYTVTDSDGNTSTINRIVTVTFAKEDINKDDIVDISDISIISTKYNATDKDEKWNESFDINNDAIIDIFDLVLISKKIE